MCKGNFKFLGVSSGESSKGVYYNLEVHGDTGSLRLRCNKEVYENGMLIPFGADCEVTFQFRTYQGSVLVQAVSISE